MHYSTYSAAVAAETRQMWNKAWEEKTVGSRTFEGLGLETKTIYCMKGIREAAYTITDRTTGLIVDCATIEEARVEFGKVQGRMMTSGYWKIAA